jgi:hypothetical protein
MTYSVAQLLYFQPVSNPLGLVRRSSKMEIVDFQYATVEAYLGTAL